MYKVINGLHNQKVKEPAIDIALPPCPAILLDLSLETQKDEPDFDKIEELVSKDVDLPTALLKMANSPLYGLMQDIDTISDAISQLGLPKISNMIYGQVLRDAFPYTDKTFMDRFLDTSINVAMVASLLASRISRINMEDAYTYGLFLNCGVPVMIQQYPEYKHTYEVGINSAVRKITDFEDEAHGTNHATVGYLLSKKWNLPEPIATAIRYHHEYSLLSEEQSEISRNTLDLLALGLLAVQIKHSIYSGFELSQWENLALEHLGLSEQEYFDLHKEATTFI